MTKPKTCSFCRRLNLQIKMDATSSFCPEDRTDIYTVAFVSETVISKRTAARITGYKHRGRGFKLNFCPECGIKISLNKLKKNLQINDL